MLNELEITPLAEIDQVKQKLAELKTALQDQLPDFENLLRTIHVALHAGGDELVALLSDEEVGVLVAGLSKRKNIEISPIVEKKTKNKTASGKKLSDATIGVDL